MTKPDQPNQTPESPAASEAAAAEWAPPHLDKLPIEDTASAAPTDFVDGGFLS
jgi:hypothetical protein